jgi:threonine synthase
MREVKNRTDYILDPHGAVAYLALKAYQKQTPSTGIFLETAHPAKFLEDVTAIFGEKIKLPPALAALETKEKTATAMPNDFLLFKQFLLTNF